MRLILAFFLIFFGHAVSAETRHALVIGIDAYASVVPLQKAVNDARAVAGALTADGYEVTLADTAEATTQDALIGTIARFADAIEPGDVALVFFAGHGVEIQGSNLLIPSDVPNIDPSQEGSERMLQSRSLSVDQLTEDLRQRSPQAVILILDACRDNPLAREGTRAIGADQGLAGMNVSTDVFVLYSAGIGQTALDRLDRPGFVDPDPNSVFTRSLLPLLAEPGLHPADIARQLRGAVADLAATVNHEQRPAYYDELPPDFALVVAVDIPPAVAVAALLAEPAVQSEETRTTIAPDPISPVVDLNGPCVAGDTAACQFLLASIPSDASSADRAINAVFESSIGRPTARDLIVAALDAGMERDLIRALQRKLSEEAGYADAIDGLAGRNTRAALDIWVQGPAPAQPPASVQIVAPAPQVVTFADQTTLTRISRIVLSAEAQNAFDTEFAVASYFGAFATSKSGGWGYTVSVNSLAAAREIAISECSEATGEVCVIMAELVPFGLQPLTSGQFTLSWVVGRNYHDAKTNVQFHAFAVSEDGAYSKQWGYPTQAAADQAAVSECETYRNRNHPNLRDMPCILLPSSP